MYINRLRLLSRVSLRYASRVHNFPIACYQKIACFRLYSTENSVQELHEQALQLFYHGDIASSEKKYIEALKNLKEKNDVKLRYELLSELGAIRRQLQKYSQGEQDIKEALKIVSENAKSIKIKNLSCAVAMGNLALIYIHQNRITEGVNLMQQVKKINVDDVGKILFMQFELANVLLQKGEVQRATEQFEDILQSANVDIHRPQRTEFQIIPIVMHSLGSCYSIMGRPNDALVLHKAAYEVGLLSNVDLPSRIYSLEKTASAYYQHGNLEQADKYLTQAFEALDSAEPRVIRQLRITLMTLRLNILSAKGNYLLAVRIAMEAMKMARKAKLPNMEAELCYRLASLYELLGDYETAKQVLQQLDHIEKKFSLKDSILTAASLEMKGRMYRREGNLPKTLEAWQKALALKERFLGKTAPETIELKERIEKLSLGEQ